MGVSAVLPRRARRIHPAATRHAPWPLVGSVLLGAVGGAWLAWATHGGIADDGYITLSMARNLAEHGCWCVTPGLWSNTATSPLWVALLAAPMLLVGPIVALAAWLTALTAATSLAIGWLARRVGWSWWAGPLAAAGLVGSPVLQASVGLESALAVALLAALAAAAAADRAGWGGLVCGLLALTRPDLAVVAVLAAIWWGRRGPLVLAAAAAAIAPWLLVSLAWFGSLVPDTLIWKQGSPGLGYTTVATALPVFLAHWPAPTLFTLAELAVGAVLAVWWLVSRPRHPITLLAAAGVVHLAAMIALRVGPFIWYLSPAVGAAVIGLALAAAARPARAGPALGLLLFGAVTLSASHDWRTQGAPFDANGALPAQYAALAARVPTGATVATEHGEVGSIAFFCSDRCRVVDPLSDPGRLAPVIERRLAASPLLRLAYPSWRPSAPVSAQWRTRYAPGGVPVWSSYSGWSSLRVEPVG